MTEQSRQQSLQDFLVANINKPEYQQRWPSYKVRKNELKRLFEQGVTKETPDAKPAKKKAKRKAKKKAAK